jgi:hypothetical protein
VTCQNLVRFVDENGIGKPELLDRTLNLFDLSWSVRARVMRGAMKIGNRNRFDVAGIGVF